MENIKFRAWHKEEKIMCKVTLLDPERGAFLIGVKPDKDQYINSGKEIVISPKDGRFCKLSEFELIQFIGLKDKNGVAIYEGDIVEFVGGTCNFLSCGNYAKDKHEIGAILIVSKLLSGYTLQLPKHKEQCIPNLVGNVSNYDFWNHQKSLKIIGNIHENPDLLK